MKLLIKLSIGLFLIFISLTSCDEVDAECKCYEDALKGAELNEECKELIEGLSEDELKEKSNECFGQTVEDMSGAVGM